MGSTTKRLLSCAASALAAVALATVATPAHAGPAPVASGAHVVVLPQCESGYYKNVSGHCVRRPTKAPHAPAGATAKCRDGSYSFSQHASGTCSHHGGVARWIHHP